MGGEAEGDGCGWVAGEGWSGGCEVGGGRGGSDEGGGGGGGASNGSDGGGSSRGRLAGGWQLRAGTQLPSTLSHVMLKVLEQASELPQGSASWYTIACQKVSFPFTPSHSCWA